METRSNHVLVGGVVLGLLALVLVSLFWIAQIGGGDRRDFDIFFKTSVDGLAKGSTVTFSGVPVGKIEQIALMADSPEFVRVRISVDDGVPVLQGTTATVSGVGFTGVSQINLDGAVKGAPPITELGPFGVPVIPTKPGVVGQLLNSAPQLLDRLTTLTERLGQLLDDRNQNSVQHILANIDRLSGSLADRGPEIAATLADTRLAVRQAGDAAQAIGQLAGTTNQLLDERGRPLMAQLQQTVAAAQRSMTNLDAAIADARPGLKAFSKQTVPQVDELVRDLGEMSEALTAVANRFNQNGAGGVIGGRRLPDYEPAK